MRTQLVADEATHGRSEYGTLLQATRRLLNSVSAANAPAAAIRAAVNHIDQADAELARFAAGEQGALAGNRPDLPGRGHPLFPPFVLDHTSATEVHGRVTFERTHLGGGGAVHGGVVPLLLDEILGRLAAHSRPPSRTAYLRVDYRRITPIGIEVEIEAQLRREEGRKLYVTGRLRHGGDVLVDAEGLFIRLRPGQP